MTGADERELLRLTNMLESLHDRLVNDPLAKEAILKAALALAVSFNHGLRGEVERLYETLDKPLPQRERDHLRSLGIDPDAETD